MSNPLVSVIVATYRRDEALRKALSSLATQTYKNIEIVLVDDNDMENWNQMVECAVSEIKASFPTLNIKMITNHPNKGSAKARNEGIYAASGEYITFLDDDDIYLPKKVENQVEFMLEQKLDYCLTDLYLYNENDILVDKRIRNYVHATDKKSLLTYHLKYHMTGTDTLMFKTDFLQRIGGFPPINVGDEFYLMLKAIENNENCGYMPGCDVKAYVHSENGGISTGTMKIKGENLLYEKKKEYFSVLETKDIQFIKMRHYAVLAVANLRSKKILAAVGNVFKSFVLSPIGFINLFISHKA